MERINSLINWPFISIIQIIQLCVYIIKIIIYIYICVWPLVVVFLLRGILVWLGFSTGANTFSANLEKEDATVVVSLHEDRILCI